MTEAAGVQGASPDHVYLVAGLRIDPARLIVAGADGRVLPVRHAPLRALILLAAQWPRPVSQAAIGRAVMGWRALRPGNTGPQALACQLRRVLPRLDGGRPMIRTVRGEGYVLDAPVVTVPREEAPSYGK